MLKSLIRIGRHKYIYPQIAITPLVSYSVNFTPSTSFLSTKPPGLSNRNRISTHSSFATCYSYQYKAMEKTMPTILDLASGMPPPEILETSSRFLAKASESLWQHQKSHEVLDYGPNFGPKSCLEQLSLFLSRRYRTGVSSDRLFVMAGSSHSLSFLPSILGPMAGRQSRVFVEQPTYMHALDVFEKDYRYDIVGVETDNFGVTTAGLQKALENGLTSEQVAASVSANRYASVLYLQTAFANPGGWSMPRQRLVELQNIAKKWNVLIMADDVYSFTNFSELTDVCPRQIANYAYLPSTCTESGDISDYIITLGSASKLLGPGLRFGWFIGSNRVMKVVDESGFILSGGCPNQYIAYLVGEMIADGSADILTDMIRKELMSRFLIANGIFRAHLPGNVQWTCPQGGFFIWLKVPKQTVRDKEESVQCLIEHLRNCYSVKVINGSRCLLPAFAKASEFWHIRVSMTALSQDLLPGALRTLADGINDYLGFKPTV